MQTNILEYLESTTEKYAEKIAFTSENETITFSELRSAAISLCSQISPYFCQCDPVIIIMEKSIRTIVSYLAVLYGGGYYIPIDSELPSHRIQSILELVGPQLIVTDTKSIATVNTLNYTGKILVVNNDENRHECLGPTDRWKFCCDVDAMYVIFTSGSTGTPKGVVTSHRSVIDYIEAFAKATNISNSDVFGNQAPLDYVAAIRDIYLPLKTGASTVLIPKKLFSVPARLFDFLDDNKITTLCWVVSALCIPAKMKAFTYKVPKYVKKVIFTGAVMPTKYLAQWQHYLPDALYVNHYGPTEITASCTYHIIDHILNDDERIPIGKPYHNTGIILLDEIGKKIKEPNVIGEICVRGCCLASGYFSDPTRSASSFIQNPSNTLYTDLIYKTGDLGSYDEKGILWFHGRMDTQIKHMGHRIELSEIEHVAKSMPNIDECCCMYDNEKEMLYLFYESTTVTPSEISAYLRQYLPSFMIPRKLIAKDKLPLRFNGKIDMQALKYEMGCI